MKTTNIFLLSIFVIFYSFKTSINSQWVDDSSIISNYVVQSVAANNEFNFVGTQGNGIFRAPINTTDWEKISKEELDAKSITSIVVKDNIIIAGTKTYGIWRTTNSGLNWNNTLQDKSVNTLLIKNNIVFAGLGSKGGIIISTNYGVSFDNTSIIGRHGVRSLIKNELYIFAATEDPGILKSSDNGDTWKNVNIDIGTYGINTLAINGNFIYAGTAKHGIYYSPDIGKTWYKSNFDENSEIYSFAFNNCFVFAATRNKGVCVLDEYGESIGNEYYDDPHGLDVYSFWIDNGFLFAGSSKKIKKRKLTYGPYVN